MGTVLLKTINLPGQLLKLIMVCDTIISFSLLSLNFFPVSYFTGSIFISLSGKIFFLRKTILQMCTENNINLFKIPKHDWKGK